MPSLGFLKKKRTREAHPDPPSTTSQPTSPVTPTAGKNVDSQPAPTSAPATQQPQAAHEVVNAQQPEATAAATATNVQTDGSHTAPQQSTQMDHSATHQLPPQQHQQHQQHQQLHRRTCPAS
ncbi:hypothetical protein VTK73DRAFT_2546 [Phialemonium thermophilum]|uniref:Uncharacterized protein n=1 Tax=Phialemonium thermophilum TaxID=223376 RepID=A0ABR3VS10_9PEZI